MRATKFGLYVTFLGLGLGIVVQRQHSAELEAQLAAMQAVQTKADFEHRQVVCLAMNAYYEARGDNRRSMIAVSQVVMNRAKILDVDPCEVVWEKTWRGCQFSWTCNPQHGRWDDRSYRKALAVAQDVYYGKVKNLVKGATHYHTVSIKPFWSRSKKFVKVDKIGSHVYYVSNENRWRVS